MRIGNLVFSCFLDVTIKIAKNLKKSDEAIVKWSLVVRPRSSTYKDKMDSAINCLLLYDINLIVEVSRASLEDILGLENIAGFPRISRT